MIEYFWEYDYKFGEFLKKYFPNTYQRKYSMTGNGIYNLITVNDKVYEIKFTEAKALLEDNNLLTTDSLKNKIIQNIINNFKEGTILTVNNGKITFKLGKFIAKVEVIKKLKIPQ